MSDVADLIAKIREADRRAAATLRDDGTLAGLAVELADAVEQTLPKTPPESDPDKIDELTLDVNGGTLTIRRHCALKSAHFNPIRWSEVEWWASEQTVLRDDVTQAEVNARWRERWP